MAGNKQEVDENAAYTQIFNAMHFFVSNQGENIYAEVERGNGVYEIMNTSSQKFKAFVRKRFRDIVGCIESKPYGKILSAYIDEAILKDERLKILSRMGGNSEETVYFLADSDNKIIKIDKSSIKSYKRLPSYKFFKNYNVLPQVMPKSRGKELNLLEEIAPFINMEREMLILYAVNLVQEFITTSSHFMSVISSKQGSGKSTLAKIWRKIVDPAKAVTTTMPRTEDELKNHLANNILVCFDNTQPLNSTFSDILCGAVTGTSYTKRKLYTDSDEVVMDLHNIIIVNGIDIIPRKSDLLERCLLFRLNPLNNGNRKTEQELTVAFDKALPYILGEIFKVLRMYFAKKDTVEIKGTHRMIDAYNDCYVIASILGVEGEFYEAFKKNQIELSAEYSETNPIISALTAYMDAIKKTEISNSVSSIYQSLLHYADKRAFPKSASAFSRELKNQDSELKKAGYTVATSKGHDFTKMTITRDRRKS